MTRKSPKPRNYHALNAIQRKAGPMSSVKREEQKEAKRIQEELEEEIDKSDNRYKHE